MKKVLLLIVGFSFLFSGMAMAKKKNLGLVELDFVDRVVSETWLEDMIPELAVDRITALQKAVDVLDMENLENFPTYSGATMSVMADYISGNDPNPIDLGLALWPWGDRGCMSSAYALESDLLSVPEIAVEFTTKVVNAGAPVADGLPLTHFVVELNPKDNYGPKFLVDRYINSRIYQVKNEFTITGYHPIMEKFVDTPFMNAMDTHYEVKEIKEPRKVFAEWMEIVTPKEPEFPCDGYDRVWINNSTVENTCWNHHTDDYSVVDVCIHLFDDAYEGLRYRNDLVGFEGPGGDSGYDPWINAIFGKPLEGTGWATGTMRNNVFYDDYTYYTYHLFLYVQDKNIIEDEGVCN